MHCKFLVNNWIHIFSPLPLLIQQFIAIGARSKKLILMEVISPMWICVEFASDLAGSNTVEPMSEVPAS